MEGQWVINGYSMGRGSMEGSMGGQWGVNGESMGVNDGSMGVGNGTTRSWKKHTLAMGVGNGTTHVCMLNL